MNPLSSSSWSERLPVGIECMDADASLEQLSSTSGGPYSVQRVKVIMELCISKTSTYMHWYMCYVYV